MLVALGSELADAALPAELARARFTVVEADSISEAHRALQRDEPVDAVVVSLGSPPDHTWDLVARIRKDVALASLPVIVLGERFSDDDAQRAEQLQCSYLSAPVVPHEIVTRLQRLLRHARRAHLNEVRVLLLTDVCEIEGTLHFPPDLPRFSDAWEAVVDDARTFVPVTDATVSTLENRRLIATPEFMEVPKAHLRGVFPVDARSRRLAAQRDETARLEKLLVRLARDLAAEKNVSVEEILAGLTSDEHGG